MKTLKVLLTNIVFLFIGTGASAAEFCNWGYAGPSQYQCDGVSYSYGSAACPSGFYQHLFCESRLTGNIQDCIADESPKTMECFRRMTQPAPTNDACNWGFAGARSVVCGRKNFCFGTAACRSGIYSDVFCKAELCQDGRTCAEDNSPETISCFNQFMQSRQQQGREGNQTIRPGRNAR